MWDLIVLVPNHCLPFYFLLFNFTKKRKIGDYCVLTEQPITSDVYFVNSLSNQSLFHIMLVHFTHKYISELIYLM